MTRFRRFSSLLVVVLLAAGCSGADSESEEQPGASGAAGADAGAEAAQDGLSPEGSGGAGGSQDGGAKDGDARDGDARDGSAPDAADALEATGDASGPDVTTPDAISEASPDIDAPTDAGDGSPTDTGGDSVALDASDGAAPGPCSQCHGSALNAAPPKDTKGNTATTVSGVGAHQSHLATPTWHHAIACAECHVVPKVPSYDPSVPSHMNGVGDVSWGPLAKSGTYQATTGLCSGTYCHGATLDPDIAGQTSLRSPTWTTVNGTQAACGTACHTLPPGGGHPAATGCPTCHGAAISAFTPGSPPVVVWANAALHVDGKPDVSNLTCTSCHGDPVKNQPAPPLGTHGETLTTQPAVGAHAQHLGTSSWHRDGQCADCHATPATPAHSNGVTDFAWGPVAKADGAGPGYTPASRTCAGVYCHGTTLLGAKAGGSVSRTPVWTTVNGTYDSCGNTCHTNPPGGTHPAFDACASCHKAVIATFDPGTQTATWTDRTKHVDGVVDKTTYHDLAGWIAPKTGSDHHGSRYFLANQQRDEHGIVCTQCHGANLDGGTSGISCDNLTCHGGKNWRGCTFCHGTEPSQANPPAGVGAETATSTLAVGRHVAHLTASSTHTAFACTSCHAVPAAGDVSHTLEYVPSSSLATAGHHGNVSLTGAASGMVWDVNTALGNPVSARGTCLGACHSDGRGGPPAVTPFWAGGSWNPGACGNCHPASPGTGQHWHVSQEGLACTVCHPAASSASHTNGKKDVNTTITVDGWTITTAKSPGGPCPNKVRCMGPCHGVPHTPKCW
jgi:predicted CxxxxCH...CXXCH cytochrome family protein